MTKHRHNGIILGVPTDGVSSGYMLSVLVRTIWKTCTKADPALETCSMCGATRKAWANSRHGWELAETHYTRWELNGKPQPWCPGAGDVVTP